MIRTARLLLIDSIDEGKEYLDKFIKLLETSSQTLMDRFLVANMVQLMCYISLLLKEETRNHKMKPIHSYLLWSLKYLYYLLDEGSSCGEMCATTSWVGEHDEPNPTIRDSCTKV